MLNFRLNYHLFLTFNKNDPNIVILFTLHANPSDKRACLIQIKGLVQGVGFRPYIYRLAMHYNLHGWVKNHTIGVTVYLEGTADTVSAMLEDIPLKAPVISQINDITVEETVPEGSADFVIRESEDISTETSEISPDIAVCKDCLSDMQQQDRRISYPFVNCTNCGPRYSIIQDFPYDRAKTTMEPFVMCPECAKEYSDMSDRRFHAQPLACKHCGPVYTFHAGDEILTDYSRILEKTVLMMAQGKIIAIKGMGGFHLMCDALNETTINRLRNLKKREGKPFAVMFKNITHLKKFAVVSPEEESALISWKRPIVILELHKSLPSGISLNLNTVGAFLPYMPIHHMLFNALKTPCLVLTSGNFSDEPILIDNESALEQLSGKVDGLMTYNRAIYNRTDDSVVRIMSHSERVFRRSRGYVPLPIRLPFDAEGIFAAGAELSNCFCIGKGNRAYMSPHIGDLKNHETFQFYRETAERYKRLFRTTPEIAATDMHPDYISTRYAQSLGLKTVSVQHHHAHIASCMAENGITNPVIGLAFDGTGYGTDPCIWGSEFMVCDYAAFNRWSHFTYMPLPGGDLAAEEPWRMALALLFQAFEGQLPGMNLPGWDAVSPEKKGKVEEMIRKNIHCPLSSGAGRLFDGVAAIVGLCTHVRYHAEAPMRLESAIMPGIYEFYDFEVNDAISFLPAIRQIYRDVMDHTDPGVISARFHNTIVEASLQVVCNIRNATGIDQVALSGGTFQNKYLSEHMEARLEAEKFQVYKHTLVPCNDGGIALGQLAIASFLRA